MFNAALMGVVSVCFVVLSTVWYFNEVLSILPASKITILRFIGYMALSYKPSTFKSYLSAERSLHIVNCFDNSVENKSGIQFVL